MRFSLTLSLTSIFIFSGCMAAPPVQYETFNLSGITAYPSLLSFEHPSSFTKTSKRVLCDNENTCIQIGLEPLDNSGEKPLTDWYAAYYGNEITPEVLSIGGKTALRVVGIETVPGFESMPSAQMFTARIFIPVQEKVLAILVVNHTADAQDASMQTYVFDTLDHIVDTLQITD